MARTSLIMAIGMRLQFQCRHCGQEEAYRSRRRSLVERFVLPLLLLKPVRCGRCYRRSWRLIFTEMLEPRPHGSPQDAKKTEAWETENRTESSAC
jgi:hypothetical protein